MASSDSGQKFIKRNRPPRVQISYEDPYDAEKQVVHVKVIKPGSGKEAKSLQAGQQAEFKVKPEGSVLSRTTVAIQGVKAELAEISAGRTVNVYWRPDETDPNARFARKIDVILSEDELDAKYGTE